MNARSKYADYRLFQLISPSLPVGAFSYSQGLEWAIDAGWIQDEKGFVDWLEGIASDSLAHLELPILRNIHNAYVNGDEKVVRYWCDWLYASRETSELRNEEGQRGRTMSKLLLRLGILEEGSLDLELVSHNQISGFAFACFKWGISPDAMCRGYAWSWLENTVMAGVKLIPLGQTSGQRIMIDLSQALESAVTHSKNMKDDDIGNFAPAQAIASSCHENQYSRLFRS